jgi:hypothetical protein
VGKKYQNNKADTSQPAVPEQVSVAPGELVGDAVTQIGDRTCHDCLRDFSSGAD